MGRTPSMPLPQDVHDERVMAEVPYSQMQDNPVQVPHPTRSCLHACWHACTQQALYACLSITAGEPAWRRFADG